MTSLLNRSGVGAKHGAPFNPLTQVTNVHGTWGDDGSWSTGKPADGGTVTAWRNQSGGGDPTNITGTPTLRASVSQFNNHAAVEFDGADDQLFFDVANTTQSFKVIVVARFTTAASAKNIVGFGDSASQGMGTNGSTQWSLHAGAFVNSSTTADTNGHVLRATANGASSELWLDGTSVATGDASTGSFSRWRLGAGGTTSGTSSRFAACQVAFFAVYSGATSDTDLATLAADLKSYYGL